MYTSLSMLRTPLKRSKNAHCSQGTFASLTNLLISWSCQTVLLPPLSFSFQLCQVPSSSIWRGLLLLQLVKQAERCSVARLSWDGWGGALPVFSKVDLC